MVNIIGLAFWANIVTPHAPPLGIRRRDHRDLEV